MTPNRRGVNHHARTRYTGSKQGLANMVHRKQMLTAATKETYSNIKRVGAAYRHGMLLVLPTNNSALFLQCKFEFE